MSTDLTVYAFDRVNCVIAGVPISGFWDGDDCVKINRAEDAVNTLVGADGNALASVTTNESAIVEFKLMPTSLSHALLRGLELKFRKSLTATPFPLVVTDFSTLAVHTSSSAIVLNRPNDTQYGVNASVRTWRIFCARLVEGSIGQIPA